MSNSLQTMIDRAVVSGNEHHKAVQEICQYCIERWGFEPSDSDVDEIIDRVFGGSGISHGMTAKDFIRAMSNAS